MSHQKRQTMPKNWPVRKKGSTFVVKPISGEVPLLVLLRDGLKIVQNRKEAKKAIHAGNILVNNKKIKEERLGLNLFDTIKIVPSKKAYKLTLDENKKYSLEEIKFADANKKVSKVVDKKILRGKNVQLNLIDGRNFISDTKCKINDSVLIDLDKKKIEKCLEFKEKANVLVFAGKHAGKKGVVNKIKLERKMASVTTKDKEKLNVLIKQIIVIE